MPDKEQHWVGYPHCNDCRWSRQIPEGHRRRIQEMKELEASTHPAGKETRELLRIMHGVRYIVCMVNHDFQLEGWCCKEYIYHEEEGL